MPDATGFIDIHSHLLPGVDDGCRSFEESIECARQLTEAGYTHCFCTPHIWPNLTENTVGNIRQWTARLQEELDNANVPLRLIPGGEISLQPQIVQTTREQLVTYGLRGKYVLIDFWADALPAFFEPTVRWLQSQGMTVILAHPERVRAIQLRPQLADYFAELGLLLQGNLQCIADPEGTPTRETADRYLRERRYFALGSDTHGLRGLGSRLDGLRRARSILGEPELRALLCDNPSKLLDDA